MRLSELHESVASVAKELRLPQDPEYLRQLEMGVGVEREHDRGKLDVVGSDVDLVKIAAAHLKELPDYYTRLKKMESGESQN